MRRQKKFYAWGYADEDLSADEIKPWEAELAERYRLARLRRHAAAQAGGDHPAQAARRRAVGAAGDGAAPIT